MDYRLIALLVWIAPAILLGCTLLWVRFKTSPAACVPSDKPTTASVTSSAEALRPQFDVMVAAE